MIRHIVQIAAIIIVALACMFYPFLPGTHDRLAVSLSFMARSLGWAGLLLVPIGVVWLIYELINRAARSRSEPRAQKGHYFAIAALAASFVVAAVVALGALTQTGPSLAVIVLIVWAYLVWRSVPGVKNVGVGGSGGFNPAPLYLIIVPAVLVLAQLWLLKPAVEFSRRRAIAGSAAFINAIEAYHAAYGRYPSSLASVHHDYDPSVIGVERYHYEPSGLAYNVFFEQSTFPIGTQEFVMYNPLDEHTMIVHNADLLGSPEGQVEQERRFHAQRAHDAGVPHWKYFCFD